MLFIKRKSKEDYLCQHTGCGSGSEFFFWMCDPVKSWS